jgi:N-acyl-D-amino-acid deacylase
MFDQLICGGEVIDGTGRARFRADVAIRGDRIAAIGDLRDAEARRRIDAAGKIVAPSFIDVHNHSDGWLFRERNFTPKTSQGFTAEVLAADGIGYAPVDENTWRQWFYYLRALNGLRVDEYPGWRTLREYVDCVQKRTAQHVVAHIPYANLRSMECGWGRAGPDDFQMRSIARRIRNEMSEGAVGLSTGLDYISQCFATTDELVEACRVVAEFDGLYVTHMRYKAGPLPALREAIEIGRRSGVRVHISHLKAPSPQEAEKVFALLDEARRDVDLSFDVYPYQPGSTMLNYLLPYEVWEDGPLAALGKLTDPHIRARFAEGLRAYRLELDEIHIAWAPQGRLVVPRGTNGERSKPSEPILPSEPKRWSLAERVTCNEEPLHGMLLSEYVRRSGLPAEEALVNLLIEERLAVLLVFHEGDDRLVHPFLQHELFMLGSDGIYHPEGAIHPRVYGSAPRMLGPLVRDTRLFTLEEAVKRMTSVPAARFRMPDRGVLREGTFADVVVFDPATIADRATFQDPHQFSVGVEHVFTLGEEIFAVG